MDVQKSKANSMDRKENKEVLNQLKLEREITKRSTHRHKIGKILRIY